MVKIDQPGEPAPSGANLQSGGALSSPPVQQIDEYRITRALGRGGMGQVFVGHDTLLDRPVAVKFLVTPTPTERLRKRFLIEARALARVHHPNIVAIYRAGISNGLPYLVSELVAGQSLDRVPKPMPWPQVLRIGIDLARGLSAVHAHGVLHRDLKPANAMLTPDGQAKLLDFGLAKLAGDLLEVPPEFRTGSAVEEGSAFDLQSAADAIASAERAQPEVLEATADATGDCDDKSSREESEASGVAAPSGSQGSQTDPRLTDSALLIGTPAYMPPEIWLGAPATELSDLYMLGEILYELCCGHKPHAYRRAAQIRSAVLHSDAVTLQKVAPTVNARFAAVIDSCIDRSPLQRPRSAAHVLSLLEAIAEDPTDEVTRRRHTRRKRLGRLLPLALAAAGALSTAGLLYREAHKREESRAVHFTPRSRVVVFGLYVEGSATPEQIGFARTFSELLNSELAAGEHLLVLTTDQSERARLELKLDRREDFTGPALAKLGSRLGPDYIVVGALRSAGSPGDALQVEVDLRHGSSGQPVASYRSEGTAHELFTMVASVGRELRARLGLAPLSRGDLTSLQAERPASLEVAQLYAEGRKLLQRFDLVGAQKVLTRVVEAEPDYPLGHLALSDALLALGRETEARREIRRAFELSGRLPRAARSLIEARYHEAPAEWPKAFALYRALRIAFPDDPEYGLYLTEAQLRAGLPNAALQTVAELRLSARIARDPRLELAAAKAQMDLSDFAAAVQAIGRAVAQAEAAASPLLLAQALLLDSFARANLNEHQVALTSAERARDLFAAAGNTAGQSEALIAAGSAYIALGDYARSEQVHEQTLQVLMGLGNSVLTAVHLGNMADLLCLRGKLELVAARAQAGLLLSREVGNREGALQSLVMLAQVALLRGSLGRAEQLLTEAQKELPEPDEPRMSAWVSWHLAELRRAQGRPEEAARLHRLALAKREQYKLVGFSAESQVALAELALASAQPEKQERAELLARQAAQRFSAARNEDGAAWAQALLSEALAREGRAAEAQAGFLPALARLGTSQNLLVRLGGLAALARAAAQLAVPDRELRLLCGQLRELITLAANSAMPASRVELSVLLFRLEQKVGEKSVTLRELCPLARCAQESGL
ncbi:MAG TPA: serine/threonine-protein kinase, partial [Pseudomonadota bacterium]|nr:serine/threonine-protein kinase [Pseudomonadota bacterium]